MPGFYLSQPILDSNNLVKVTNNQIINVLIIHDFDVVRICLFLQCLLVPHSHTSDLPKIFGEDDRNGDKQSLGPGLASRQLQCVFSFVMSKTTNKRAGVRIREYFVLSAPQFLHMGSSFTVLSMGIL